MGRIAEALKKAQRERISNSRQTSMQGEIDLRDVGVKTGRLPRACPAMDPLKSRLRSAAGSAAPAIQAGGSSVWPAAPQIVTLFNPMSRIAEQYRAARTWLLSRVKSGERQCVAFTGSRSSEGTSVSTANLAVVMSEVAHMRVLVIDANLRKSSLASLFQLPTSPGLSDVLSGGTTLQDAVIRTPRANLFFLPAGVNGVFSPAELLNSRHAANVFDHLRDSFDYILVDTPAIQDCSDVGVIGAVCSGIVVVVRMHQTPAPVVQQSIQWLQDNRLNVIGCLGARSSPDA
jgi:capsular exopolysaccharide synthesis family protein